MSCVSKFFCYQQHSAMWIHVTLVRCSHLNQEGLSSSPVGFVQKPSRRVLLWTIHNEHHAIDRWNCVNSKRQIVTRLTRASHSTDALKHKDRWNCVGTWSTQARVHWARRSNAVWNTRWQSQVTGGFCHTHKAKWCAKRSMHNAKTSVEPAGNWWITAHKSRRAANAAMTVWSRQCLIKLQNGKRNTRPLTGSTHEH